MIDGFCFLVCLLQWIVDKAKQNKKKPEQFSKNHTLHNSMMIERRSLSTTKTTQCQMAITKIIIKTNDNGIRTSKHSNGHHPHHLFHLIFFLWLISIQSIVVVVVDCYSISNPTFDSEIVIVDGRRQNQAQSKSLSSSSSSPQSSSSSSSSATTIPTTIASTIQSSNHPNYNYYFTSNNHQHNDGSNNNHGNHDGNNGGNGGGEHQELPPRRFQVAKFDFEHGMFHYWFFFDFWFLIWKLLLFQFQHLISFYYGSLLLVWPKWVSVKKILFTIHYFYLRQSNEKNGFFFSRIDHQSINQSKKNFFVQFCWNFSFIFVEKPNKKWMKNIFSFSLSLSLTLILITDIA